MPSFRERFREVAYPWPVRANIPAAVEQAFAEERARRFDHQAKVLQIVILLCDLIWWPFDWVVFAPFPWRIKAMIPCRLILAGTAALYLALPRRPAVRRALFWIFTAAACVQAWAAGDNSGTIGGPDSPYFHTLYMVMFATIPLPLALGRRALLTALLAVSLAIGHVLRHPQHFASEQLPLIVSFLTLSVLLSSWFGHTQYVLGRDNFAQAHELAEQARLLESRVAERTEELRRLLDHVETAREDERARVARELHDELGQELSALRFSLGFTRVRYAKEPAGIGANLEDLEGLLRRTAQTTRDLVTDLRPRVLDDLGLGAAVEWLVRRVEERGDLACRLAVSGELGSLDERVATTAFRVLQESMTNAVRHASAKELDIEISAGHGRLELLIKDDGIGVDAGRAKKGEESSGVGILGMRERVNAAGGSLSIRDRAPARGTEVRCALPLTPPSSRPAGQRSRRLAAAAQSGGAP